MSQYNSSDSGKFGRIGEKEEEEKEAKQKCSEIYLFNFCVVSFDRTMSMKTHSLFYLFNESIAIDDDDAVVEL